MGPLAYLVILAVFLTMSWVVRIVISQDVTRRVDRKIAEDNAGFCIWPREIAE